VSSQTLILKPKEETAVVALGVVVHESTSKLMSATGGMVYLFGSDFELVMICWIVDFRNKGHLEGSGTNTW
jgi:hypothetical protein